MARPVVFVHGLWLHATSWQSWIELFREAGYDPIAPGWPGEPATIAEARAIRKPLPDMASQPLPTTMRRP